MTGKVSKKDQKPTQVAEDRAALEQLALVKSTHFTEGTWIVAANRRGEILERRSSDSRTALVVRWESGEETVIYPRALNPTPWRSRS